MGKLCIALLVGYLLGSVNISILLTRLVGGFDIRTRGSQNAGGTNVARTLGAGWGALTILLEILKSSLLGLAAKYWFPAEFPGLSESGATVCALAVLCACVLGNAYPCFSGFRGGKGVTVMAAAAIVIDWRVFLLLLVLFFVIMLLSRYVSLASMMVSLGLPLGAWLMLRGTDGVWPAVGFAAFFAFHVLFRHRSNIQRLVQGKENRVSWKKGKDS